MRDIGREIGGHVLTEQEYLDTENRYLHALRAFAQESDVRRLTVVDLYKPPAVPQRWQHLREGETVSLDDAVEIVRVMLREGPLFARLEDADRFYVHVGDYMYMWIGSHVDCVNAVAEAERVGLFVDPGVESSVAPHPDDERYWWLDEDRPIRHVLVSFARDDGRTLQQWAVPDEKVPQLRALFEIHAGDDQFYDAYEVDEVRRARVSEILDLPLSPELRYSLATESVPET
jgi:hypothetical protein